jgi:ABC-type transport system involved in multi-copper enzyme maturation permease subunit
MSIHAPQYTLERTTLRPHRARVGVVLSTTVRERFGPLNLALLVFIFIVVLLTIVVPFYFANLVPQLSSGISLATFFLPFSSHVWFFFQILLIASVGAGVIAGDVATRAITMYFARPITRFDYLAAKASAVALWLGLAVVVPPLIGTVIVLALGYASLVLALEAAAAFLGVGLLTVFAFTALTLLISAWAPKASYAGAAIFGLLAGTDIVALVVSGIGNDSRILYFSPEQNVLAVARAAFGVSSGGIDPAIAGVILAGVGVVALLLTRLRLDSIEVVSE